MALDAGAKALGFVSAMPSGPGVLPESDIARIISGLPPACDSFLLTSKTKVDQIVDQVARCRPRTLQLCDAIEPTDLKALRRELPDLKLVPVVHVRSRSALDQARALEEFADAILLDSGRPEGANPSLGGTGETHDWNISREIRDALNIPVYLAGGLNPENVTQALEVVHPYAVDVCSGVRSEGHLDPDKLEAFMKGLA